jgi:putative tricarboxylic transport membrane protein
MIKADRWIGLLVALFSLYVCIESVRLGLGTFQQPGPGFLPFGAAATLGVLSLALIAFAHFGRTKIREAWPNPGRIFTVFLALLGFTLLLEWLGFLLSAFLLVGFLLKVVEARSWRFSVAVATLVAGGSYVIFDVWLRAQLPAGFWGS